MDLENESSALESVEDNDVTSAAHVDDAKIKNNGSCANDFDQSSSDEDVDSKTDTKGQSSRIEQPLHSIPITTLSPGVSGGSPTTITKGLGLKKWRRIRRDFVKDASSSIDSSKILKRGLSGSANPTKPLHLSDETRQKSEATVEYTNMLAKNLGSAVGSTFAAGTDSENSEDRSSKSSTAASAPRLRYDMAAVMGYVREKNRMKNLSGKTTGNLAQRNQQGKSRIETSKKPRGERVKIEKENSHSSMESDSRSSNFVFMQGVSSAVSNGKQTGQSTIYDEENDDEAQASEQQFSEDLQTDYSKENVEDIDLSQDEIAADLSWKKEEERSGNHTSDPLVKSILVLQSVQEALEKELQKFGEIGKESVSSETNLSPSDELGSENVEQNDLSSLKTEVIRLTQKVNYLESKLEETSTMLEAKESLVVELQATLNSGDSLKEKSRNTKELEQEMIREMETELEGLFRQKIEAEVEYLAIVRTIQTLRVAAGDDILLFEGKQAQMLNKLEEAKSKAETLKKEAEGLESYCGEILETDEVLKMQKRVFKISWCFFIQLILVVVVFWLFILQLSPPSGVVVPT